jgi:dATP/dGTP diphosphohydrolase
MANERVLIGRDRLNSLLANSTTDATEGSGQRPVRIEPSTNFANTSDGGDKMSYEEYLSAYHGMSPPISREEWERIMNDRVMTRPERLVPRYNEDRTNPKDAIDVTKLPLRFIPPSSLAFLARVMELGANKYGPMNWRDKSVRATVYYEAALRHILSALDGEELDPESGQPHAAHAMACMAILLDAKATGNLVDDRFASGAFGRLVQEMISGEKK